MRRLLTCMFIASVSMGIVGLALPIYARDELGASYTEIGLLGVTYCILNGALSIPIGRWMDRRGGKPLLVMGLFSMVFVFVLYAYTRSVWQVLAIRLLAGAVETPLWVGMPAAVADLSRPEAMGRAMGSYGLSWGAGFTLGPLLCGFLYVTTGAAKTFMIGALVVLTAAALMLFTKLPRPPQASTPERRKRKGLGPACFVGFIYVGIVSVVYTLLPPYALGLGLKIGQIGLLITLFTAIRVIFFIPFGALSDRVGYRLVILLGTFGAAAACMGIVAVRGFMSLLLVIAFLGVTEGSLYPTVLSMTSKIGGMLNRGYTLGILNVVEMVGWGALTGVGGFSADVFGATAPYVLLALIALAAASVTMKFVPKRL